MYFPGEKLNVSDQIYNAIPVNKEGAIAHAVALSEGMASDALAFAWDIVLGAQGGTGQSLM